MVVKIDEIEKIIINENDEYSLVKKLFLLANEGDYIVKHRCYYVLKEIGSKFSIEFIDNFDDLNKMLEEDVLRIIDITTKLEVDSPLHLKRLLNSKNPYLVRGEAIALAKNGSVKSLDVLLEFAVSNKGRIIRRELFGELFGYMIYRIPELKAYIENKKWDNQKIRGYLRDMEINSPKYNRLSIYPSNDYWALKAREQGFEYGEFKYSVEKQMFKKNHKGL
ncbi:MAG: HEAT repeat domain-containing protein [Firmicutes bacterium]|nr:HEAT repeat domain-containing protein [Bacillota bacterium]